MATYSQNHVAEQNPKKLENNDPECFHRAIGPILAIAQLFGILPIIGVHNRDPGSMKFRKKSFRTFFTIVTIILLGAMIMSVFMTMVKASGDLTFAGERSFSELLETMIFFGHSSFVYIFFLWLSPKWIKLQRKWEVVERKLESFHHNRPRLRCKFFTISSILMFFAVTEHFLSEVNNKISARSPSDNFNTTWNEDSKSTNLHRDVNNQSNIRFGMVIILIISSRFATFAWSFSDLFIILVSTGLAEQYKSLNNAVLGTHNRRDIDWPMLREKYTILSNLVKQTDKYISPLILSSFAINLYLICFQLLGGLSFEKKEIVSKIYFFSSFLFLVGRTVAVTLSAARINDQSKISLPAIFRCPTSNFTTETQRLQHQLATDNVALSGMRFFFVTKSFMLAVASAIITYEIVLLQFDSKVKQ